MKTLSGKDMVKLLEQRGWAVVRINGSHHHMRHPDFPLAVNVPVHSNHDLPKGTQRSIMRDAGLADSDL